MSPVGGDEEHSVASLAWRLGRLEKEVDNMVGKETLQLMLAPLRKDVKSVAEELARHSHQHDTDDEQRKKERRTLIVGLTLAVTSAMLSGVVSIIVALLLSHQ